MAGVWEAHDELLDRAVAVKVLAQHLSEDDRARARFEREARAAAGLSSHPNVVTIYDVGEHDGRAFIVMELMRGGTVADGCARGRGSSTSARCAGCGEAASGARRRARRRRSSTATSSPATCCSTTATGSRSPTSASPASPGRSRSPQTGQVLGTAAYISPEQAMGEPATAASDRYALAVVAFELLTGEKPFEAEHFAAQARAHIEDDPPRVSELRPGAVRARRRRASTAAWPRIPTTAGRPRRSSSSGSASRSRRRRAASPCRPRPRHARWRRATARRRPRGRPARSPRPSAPGSSGPGTGMLLAALAAALLIVVLGFLLLKGNGDDKGNQASSRRARRRRRRRAKKKETPTADADGHEDGDPGAHRRRRPTRRRRRRRRPASHTSGSASQLQLAGLQPQQRRQVRRRRCRSPSRRS